MCVCICLFIFIASVLLSFLSKYNFSFLLSLSLSLSASLSLSLSLSLSHFSFHSVKADPLIFSLTLYSNFLFCFFFFSFFFFLLSFALWLLSSVSCLFHRFSCQAFLTNHSLQPFNSFYIFFFLFLPKISILFVSSFFPYFRYSLQPFTFPWFLFSFIFYSSLSLHYPFLSFHLSRLIVFVLGMTLNYKWWWDWRLGVSGM